MITKPSPLIAALSAAFLLAGCGSAQGPLDSLQGQWEVSAATSTVDGNTRTVEPAGATLTVTDHRVQFNDSVNVTTGTAAEDDGRLTITIDAGTTVGQASDAPSDVRTVVSAMACIMKPGQRIDVDAGPDHARLSADGCSLELVPAK